MHAVAAVGSIMTDLAVFTPRLPQRGENLLAHRLQIGPGGKGANAAAAAVRLGARAVLVGAVGDDHFGREDLAALRREGVVVDGVTIDRETSTGAAVILIDATGENTTKYSWTSPDRNTLYTSTFLLKEAYRGPRASKKALKFLLAWPCWKIPLRMPPITSV